MAYKSINFSKFSSIKIGGEHEVFLIEDCDYPRDAYLLGACNNIIMGDNPPSLMMLSKKYDFITINEEHKTFTIGAATPSGKINSFCKKHNIAHFEFVSHLPGTLGGLVKMNAGLKEWEIFEHLIEIRTCHGVLKKEQIGYGYRYTDIQAPILEATFALSHGYDNEKLKMFTAMRNNQPSTPSAGSCFKNPLGDYAGRLIEAVGLKGKRVGDMEFSQMHANFLVNHGKGTFQEAIQLINEAKTKVFEEFGIFLECEVEILEKEQM